VAVEGGSYAIQPSEGEALPFIGRLKVSADQSGGSFELFEYEGPAVPPVHVHRDREEVFFILEGHFTFTVGDETIEADPGTAVLVPRGTPHGFRPDPGAKALFVVAPAGLGGFFRDLGAALAAGRSSDEIRAELAGRYDSHPAGGPGP
jgi:mannose-6-phosphate isomerase-like protein (cupin superfamily)